MGILSELERGAHLIGRYLEETAGHLEISQAEAHVLAQLARHGSLPIGLLHERFGHKRSTLTSVIDRLERRGLAKRELNPEDRRSFLVHLTPRGRRAAVRVTKTLDALEGELTAKLGRDQLDAVSSVVEALESAAAAPSRPRGT
jgi:DNA-binding MarR family transcriptional regulator